MPAFKYEALSPSGDSATGLLEADSAKQARSLLRARQLTPLDVQPVQEDDAAAAAPGLFKRSRMNALEQALFTRQLSSLLQSGLPLERALAALGEESEREATRGMLAVIRSSVSGGSSLAAALREQRAEFDELFINIVAAGEESGKLGEVLAELADFLEARQALRSKLIGAMMYPLIVLVVALFIVALLLGYVVPQVATVFVNAKQKLPLITTVMMFISGLLRDYWWLAILLVGAGVGVFKAAMASAAGALAIDRFTLRIPIFGKLARSVNTARFSSTLAILVASGVPMLKALQAAGQTLSNSLLKRDVDEAIVLVREGSSLASALALHKRFPAVLLMFVRLGEQTGQLPLMLRRAAKQHAEEVQRRVSTLTSLIEPIMILGMGVIVLLIVLAVLLPIMQMNSLVK